MNWTTNNIRKTFIDFFNSKQHHTVHSAPIVLKQDPTLMFTNAGMNQFKDYFLGNEEPKFNRVCNAQKCLRVSGKHNDLEEVGVDTYHHTMFEMLGNWSFGDYFKTEAIDMAWELLTEVYKIPADRLYITVFGGDEEDRLQADTEAEEHWKKHVPKNRIMRFDKKDNFWEMGASGPCGPASEIHVDIRPEAERKKADANALVNQDHPQVIEIWNLVFIQFNRAANGKLSALPKTHVDTGMGIERLAMVLQGKTSNYDIDLFQTLTGAIEEKTGAKYGGSDQKEDVAIRVIADHLRAVAFCIADGQLPSNTGAGYVVRRVLRRAVRYGFSFLGADKPVLFELVETLRNEMAEAYPELKKQAELITNVIKEEEVSFLRTLEKGIERLSEYRAKNKNEIDGAFAFELYDTYGFPIDLTTLMASENRMKVDQAGFEKALQSQKKRSKEATQKDTGDWVIITNEQAGSFTGYDEQETDVKILRYRRVATQKGTFFQLVLNRTPFYPEGGGQVGDTGVLTQGKTEIKITNTLKENNLIIHIAPELPDGDPDAVFRAKINEARRNAASANHTATHLVHFALRKTLGKHVEQKGSLVTPEYLRFDFSHFKKVEQVDLNAIEREVNKMIWANYPLIENRNANPEEAIQQGALALFGEKYGDKVRTIKFGNSMELCGGTHLKSTGAAGLFKITTETSVASGVRRIEAITGVEAYERAVKNEDMLASISSKVKSTKNPEEGVDKLLEEKGKLESIIESYEAKEKDVAKAEFTKNLGEVNGIRFSAQNTHLDPGSIKDICFSLKKELTNTVLVFGSEGKKVTLSLFITPDLVEKHNLNAGKWIRDLAQKINGGGGGQPFFATAGGSKASGLPEVYEVVKTKLESL